MKKTEKKIARNREDVLASLDKITNFLKDFTNEIREQKTQIAVKGKPRLHVVK